MPGFINCPAQRRASSAVVILSDSRLCNFEQFSALASAYHLCQPAFPALEEVMENLAELMQRLLEIQSSGRQRSPELIAEDDRLMDGLRKRMISAAPPDERG
jgi:hypothetical protein